jgi:hypothetical protein
MGETLRTGETRCAGDVARNGDDRLRLGWLRASLAGERVR